MSEEFDEANSAFDLRVFREGVSNMRRLAETLCYLFGRWGEIFGVSLQYKGRTGIFHLGLDDEIRWGVVLKRMKESVTTDPYYVKLDKWTTEELWEFVGASDAMLRGVLRKMEQYGSTEGAVQGRGHAVARVLGDVVQFMDPDEFDVRPRDSAPARPHLTKVVDNDLPRDGQEPSRASEPPEAQGPAADPPAAPAQNDVAKYSRRSLADRQRELLELLAGEPEGLAATVIRQRLGWYRSTTQEVLSRARKEGLVVMMDPSRTTRNQRYRLCPHEGSSTSGEGQQ